jgi:hypothetical protein
MIKIIDFRRLVSELTQDMSNYSKYETGIQSPVHVIL